MTRLKGLLILPTFPMQRRVALMKRMKIVMKMTSSKILKMIAIWWNKLGNPQVSNLANIINNFIRTPINKDKLFKKLESHTRSENLDLLNVKKCNTEIWSEMLKSKTRSKDTRLKRCKVAY